MKVKKDAVLNDSRVCNDDDDHSRLDLRQPEQNYMDIGHSAVSTKFPASSR